jgi:ligand-binding sensor domain-containing protein
MLQLSEEGKIIGRVHLPDAAMEHEDVQADSHGDLWACSDKGLLHKTAGGHPILTYEAPLKRPCLAFAIDRQGDIWYGDFGQEGGLALVEEPAGTRPRMRHFAGGGEVGAATVRFLGVDNRSWIWRGSTIGVYVADPDQARHGRWLYLNGLDGIAGTDANHRSFL